MSQLTLFTFGYYGWGSSTPELVQAVNAVERIRGYKPPIFVDVRIQRNVRAVGFDGNAFGELLGQNCYRWMKSLGNEQITKKSGPQIQIANPGAVNELLDLAAEAADDRRRILFFCGCEWPRYGRQIGCHRTTVAGLTIQAAKRRGMQVDIVEWPGGKPEHVQLATEPVAIAGMLRGRRSFSVEGLPLGESAAIAWGSPATIRAADRQLNAVIGPIQFRRGQWQFPVLKPVGESLAIVRQQGAAMRKWFGLGPQRS